MLQIQELDTNYKKKRKLLLSHKTQINYNINNLNRHFS